MDIFEALRSEELETIAQLLRERRLSEADVLCRQGDPGDALFIVTGGRIRLSTTDPSGNEKVLTYSARESRATPSTSSCKDACASHQATTWVANACSRSMSQASSSATWPC